MLRVSSVPTELMLDTAWSGSTKIYLVNQINPETVLEVCTIVLNALSGLPCSMELKMHLNSKYLKIIKQIYPIQICSSVSVFFSFVKLGLR